MNDRYQVTFLAGQERITQMLVQQSEHEGVES